MHVRATANTGATREDICEAFLHVAIYAGVPAANRAIKIAKEVFAEMDAQAEGMMPAERLLQPRARNRRLLPARPRLASAGIDAGLQDLRAALAAAGAVVLRQHAVGDHRAGVRARHPRRTRQRPDPQFRQAGRKRDRRAHHRLRPGARRARRWRSRRAAGGLAGQCRRPLPPQARDGYLAPLDPNFGGCGRTITGEDGGYCLPHRSSPDPIPGRTAPTTGGPRISTSRCSATASRSG